MMRLPPFRYLAPETLEEAASLLQAHGPAASLVAGGTDLYPNMKRRQCEPRILIGLARIPSLSGIRGTADQGVTIGALTTLEEIATDPMIREFYPALGEAAELVATPQIRNAGTLGGNLCADTRCTWYNQSFSWRKAAGFCLKKDGAGCQVAPGSTRCWAVSPSDTAPVLCALDARLRLVGPGGERMIPALDLYNDDGIAFLTKGHQEILAEIRLPPARGMRSTYLKLRRRESFDFPVLGVAVALRMDGQRVESARIVLGALASCPIQVDEAGAALEGEPLDEACINRAADAAAKMARPLDNTDLPNGYRKRMTRVLVIRALRRLAGGAGVGGC